MKKVLITGSSGMLGKDIFEILSEVQSFNIYGFDRIFNPKISKDNQIVGDLTDYNLLIDNLNNISPDIIIHCAAIVNLNICEENKKTAAALHCEVTNKLSSYNSISTKFIYISTDSVFDGKRGDYTETDTPNPINYYANSKLKGEKAALQSNDNTIIVRTNIYGFNYPLGNSLAEWAIKNLKQGKSINGFTDTIFNAIYTKQLARIIRDLIIKNNYNGILNIAGNEYVSKYEFLLRLAKVFNYSPDLIKKSYSDNMNFMIPRPKNTSLNIGKLKNVINEIPNLNEGLKEFYKDYKKTFNED
ncbi:MAG: dTDP-4-dehydrorhamnose reductase family protein [Candidatus Helarchaeota archaeon]